MTLLTIFEAAVAFHTSNKASMLTIEELSNYKKLYPFLQAYLIGVLASMVSRSYL